MAAIKYWLWLASQSNVSPRARAALIAHYGGAEEAFFAPSGAFARLPGLTERDAALLETRDLRRVDAILSACHTLGLDVVTMQDAAYPARLKAIFAPPVALFVQGSIRGLDEEAAVSVIGTRSAVFAPCENLGLIILDEEQEHSYKSENSPRYAAREVAMWRGSKEAALVVLGSATPSVESMYHAKQGHYRLYRLQNRYNGRPLPETQIVDLREELKLGNDGILSIPLRQAIHDTLAADKQAILLLNRRGNSRALVCVDCRKAPECPRCSERLTYHSANNRLLCHYCGYSVPVPDRCPNCGGPLKTLGTGTQRVQQELSALFPDVEVARMDADTVSASNPHEAILDRFRRGEQKILLGTQMVAKGLDMPNVTLVGVLDADLSLFTGGFRAGETTFDMLTQVVGRAGRGSFAGQAILQTMVPNHELIQLAARQDYDRFYDLEIRLRQVQHVPPFADQVLIAFQGLQEPQVLMGAVKFRDSLLQLQRSGNFGPMELLGPAPSPVPKINYQFRYRLTLRCRLEKNIRAALSYLLSAFGKDSKMRGVNAFIDVNGFEG